MTYEEAVAQRIPEGEPAPEGFCEICGLPGGWHDEDECNK